MYLNVLANLSNIYLYPVSNTAYEEDVIGSKKLITLSVIVSSSKIVAWLWSDVSDIIAAL